MPRIVLGAFTEIMDCDAVLVLSEGRVVEMGPARELVQAGGAFAGMVQQAAE